MMTAMSSLSLDLPFLDQSFLTADLGQGLGDFLLNDYEPHLDGAILSPSSISTSFCHTGKQVSDDPTALQWLLENPTPHSDSKADSPCDMDWMTEQMNLNEFDLDFLAGSCDLEGSSSSPEELIASLDPCSLDLGELPLHPPVSLMSPASSDNISEETVPPVELVQEMLNVEEFETPLCISEPITGLNEIEQDIVVVLSVPEVKCEPTSPISLVSESNLESETILVYSSPSPPFKEEVEITDDGDSGIGSNCGSPPGSLSPNNPPSPMNLESESTMVVVSVVGFSRAKPYARPPVKAEKPHTAKLKSASSEPRVVEKKIKKMQQNKTAATRYRQKKRAENDALQSECSELETKNKILVEKVESITKEIQYLKDLIEEVRNAKKRKQSTL
ncbi:cyclic AMP-dependent transcription factor ATF-4 isoform X1 [Polypterus senegalus]|uniref:cyclic AMP-dependent transcription factor ATF-4 isoform X1 n=1 Tax=Polypterus senegalus TaxID=55291 RepID=UPI0019633F95|nr:cyclic AMP-dependent transcription factor ATF-4 isoform X1 [Polypterus senegalus]